MKVLISCMMEMFCLLLVFHNLRQFATSTQLIFSRAVF
uniref:Uncharacterized protein n=1 Tax=Anguilla anguilla TaxID=7936 RepID=A0A0E9WKJ2_ANGAN